MKKIACRKHKYYYRSKTAYDEYKTELSDCRAGVNMDKEEFDRLDKLISELIINGQPISHIYSYLEDQIPCTQRTIYNYFSKGILTADNMDLPRKVRYKPREKHVSPKDNDSSHRQGRTYEDFRDYILENMDTEVIEMDTVFGKRGASGKVLLTMLLRRSSIMLMFLMHDCTGKSVSDVFDKLKGMLGSELFKATFPVFLTDNGSEFKHWDKYLSDENGEILAEIFFCDPNAAYQKGRVEKNHEYIRYFLPKGTAFTGLDEQMVTIMMNHINSTARPSLNDKSPYELGLTLLPQKLVVGLGLATIPNEEVSLTRKLFR